MKNDQLPSSEKTKYSSSELEEFKTLILKKIERAKSDIKSLKTLLCNQNGTDDTDRRGARDDASSESAQREHNYELISRQEKFIVDLNNALMRIENKTYGVCRVTGKLIGKQRLKAVPHATLSIEGKEIEKARQFKAS